MKTILNPDTAKFAATNCHGVTTIPAQAYKVTTEINDIPILAVRTRHIWNKINGAFIAYDKFVTSAELVTD